MPEAALIERPPSKYEPRAAGISDLLVRRAMEQPDMPAYVFVGQGLVPDEVLTWREVLSRSAGVAALLQERGLQGSRVLLAFRSNASFAIALLGSLLAGAIAVPLPPRSRPGHEGRHPLIGLKRADVTWIDAHELDDVRALHARAAAWEPSKVAAEAPAMLQYTSGCTGRPKGVLVTHGQLLANSEAIRCGFATTRHTIGLLPGALSLDMGVIGGILQPLYTGCRVHLLESLDFEADPIRWLELIDQRRVTLSGGTVSAYERLLCALRARAGLKLDLSCWKTAFIGGDLVPASTLHRLAEELSPHGFDPAAITPCYGLAEATLLVSAGRYDHASRSSTASAKPQEPEPLCCGRPVAPTQIRVVDPVSRQELAEGEEGEIWVSGPAVATGYWRDAQRTRATMRARLPADAQNLYLRTGDRGFMQAGQLYPTGRQADLLSVRGRQVSAESVERAAQGSHPLIAQGGAVAFSVLHAGRRRLVLALELAREASVQRNELWFIGQRVREWLLLNHDIEVDEVVMLRPGDVPRSPGGKLQRSKCKSEYEQGTLATLM